MGHLRDAIYPHARLDQMQYLDQHLDELHAGSNCRRPQHPRRPRPAACSAARRTGSYADGAPGGRRSVLGPTALPPRGSVEARPVAMWPCRRHAGRSASDVSTAKRARSNTMIRRRRVFVIAVCIGRPCHRADLAPRPAHQSTIDVKLRDFRRYGGRQRHQRTAQLVCHLI